MTFPDSEAAPILEVSDLAIRYRRRRIVDGVTFSLAPGEGAAIVGRSGSGKSSILSAVIGLVKPAVGSVRFAGQDVARMSRAQREQYLRHDIGVVFQHGELLDDLEARENVMVAALLSGLERDDAYERSTAILCDLGLEPAGTRARDMSGGERQRIAIARALVTSPQLVIADEPTGSLDAEFRDVVAGHILDVPRRWGSALLMVTHDETLAAQVDTRYRLRADSDGPAQLELA